MEIIKLNVGGVKYETTLQTITSKEGSILTKMFDGKFKIEKDESGYIFIDRDGQLFKYILDYHRGYQTNSKDLDAVTLSRLKNEIEYFNLQGLLIETETKNEKDENEDELYFIQYEKVFDPACRTLPLTSRFRITRSWNDTVTYDKNYAFNDMLIMFSKGFELVYGSYGTKIGKLWFKESKIPKSIEKEVYKMEMENIKGE